MKAIPRSQQNSLNQGSCVFPDNADDIVPINLSITATDKERADLFTSILSQPSVQSINLKANEFRGGPDAVSKEFFRKSLLKELRKGWNNVATEARFFRLVELLQRDGCAVFAGLLDVDSFRQLIDSFSKIMRDSGSHAFLHSFANLVDHPGFFQDPKFSDAIVHPLLIALLSYEMGGPIRMIDARAKDTQPISVNAQDNMLHMDNTPFRAEYKILLGWEKGEVKGPSGQNFTFLPGTHKGGRLVRLDEQSQPWSTENDSLFNTDSSLDNVFKFQRDITGSGPKVVEVEYPEQPITVVFNASSLVHHRYRNRSGSTRSCVITAFHLASDSPGAFTNSTANVEPESVSDILLGYQNGTEVETFCSLIGSKASVIESKIFDILDDSHQSTLVDTSTLTLSGERLERWRNITINAPSATQLKFEGRNYISFVDDLIPRALLVEKLSAAMDFDKHGLLDLTIYMDSQEEIRKPARKTIWTMSKEKIAHIVASWLPAVEAHKFTLADVQNQTLLKHKAHEIASLIRESFPAIDFVGKSSHKLGREELQLCSAHRLIADLGDAITRCEKAETYTTSNLYLFLLTDQVIQLFDWASRQKAIAVCAVFLKAYIACVLVVEMSQR